jgi:hypothetical protein
LNLAYHVSVIINDRLGIVTMDQGKPHSLQHFDQIFAEACSVKVEGSGSKSLGYCLNADIFSDVEGQETVVKRFRVDVAVGNPVNWVESKSHSQAQ